MSEWVLQEEDKLLPDWLKQNLRSTCAECGNLMLNYYNEDNRCTHRKCSNPNCPGLLGSRADFMVKLLNIKGIGYATCANIIRTTGTSNHVSVLGSINIKPTIKLHEYLRIHCFEGVDSEWEVICESNDYYTLDELYNSYDGKYRDLLKENKQLLYDNLKYVTLVEKPKRLTVEGPYLTYNVMITGTPNEFDTKEQFIEICNRAMGGLIKILHQKSKRQSGVDYLIAEPGSTTKGKREAAIKGGIPIVTSSEFADILLYNLAKIKSENNLE